MVSSKKKVIANFMNCKNVDSELVHNVIYLSAAALNENRGSEEAARARINTV